MLVSPFKAARVRWPEKDDAPFRLSADANASTMHEIFGKNPVTRVDYKKNGDGCQAIRRDVKIEKNAG
jgi:hypothetical protein